MRIPLLALLALLAIAAPAAAAPGQRLLFEAPNELRDPSRRDAALNEMQSLGVRATRVILYWNDVAPDRDARQVPGVDLTDPAAYNWGSYDAVIDAARSRGLEVLVTISGPVPTWATGKRRGHTHRPSPTQFARFATAVGRRYGGQVDSWAIWNEPNLPRFLTPQYVRGTKRPLSPRIYRRLFFAGERGLRASGNGGDQILAGETAPRGTRKVVAPLTFLRGTLCLNSRYRRAGRCSRLPADGWAHHPYTTRSGPFFRPPGRNDVTIGVLSRLTRALDRAARAGRVRRGMPIHLTEFGIQSTPDRLSGVSLARQHEFRALSERLAFGNRRVKTFSQYLLRDDQPNEQAKSVFTRYPGFESGLRFANGREKPSLRAFRLSLSALRRGRRAASVSGIVRPAQGPVTADVLVQDRGQRRFRLLRRVRTNSRGEFTFRATYRPKRRFLLQWNGLEGAPVRIYRR